MTATGPGRTLLIVAAAVVAATVAAALVVLGSPAAQREARLDEARQQDLAAIGRAVSHFWVLNKRLPESLAVLAEVPGIRLTIVDPVDRTPYGYEITGADSYRLCAVFSTDTGESPGRSRRFPDWEHGRGRACFERSATAAIGNEQRR